MAEAMENTEEPVSEDVDLKEILEPVSEDVDLKEILDDEKVLWRSDAFVVVEDEISAARRKASRKKLAEERKKEKENLGASGSSSHVDTIIQHAEDVSVSTSHAQIGSSMTQVTAASVEVASGTTVIQAGSVTLGGNLPNIDAVSSKKIGGATVYYPKAPDEAGNVQLTDSISYNIHHRIKEGRDVFMGVRKGAVGDEDVVVKLLTIKSEREKRMDEIKALMKLRHLNAVSYHDSGRICSLFGNGYFVTMELCKTDTLRQLFQYGDPTIKLRKTILLHILHGVWHIHEAGFIHRDLKPDNIIEGIDGRHIKIADYGLSKETIADKPVSNSIVTRGWGPPEFYETGAKLTQASDIYPIGLLFFYVLSGGCHIFGAKHLYWEVEIKDRSTDEIAALLHGAAKGSCKPDLGWETVYPATNHLKGNFLAVDVIQAMLKKERNDRRSIEDLLRHPFFWEPKTKLDFICHVADRCESESRFRDPGDELFEKVSNIKIKGWLEFLKLNSREVANNPYDEVGPFFKFAWEIAGGYTYNSAFDLLRFIRDCRTHRYNDTKSWKLEAEFDEIIKDDSDLWNFLSSREEIHRFFCNIYNAVWDLHKNTSAPLSSDIINTIEKKAPCEEIPPFVDFTRSRDINAEKSQHISAKQGGSMGLLGYAIHIPQQALPADMDNTQITISLENDQRRLPSGAVSLILRCLPPIKFLKPVTVVLKPWCSSEESFDAEVQYKDKKAKNWKQLRKISVTKEAVSFEVKQFARFVLVDKRQEVIERALSYDIIINIFIEKQTAAIAVVVCRDRKTEQDVIESFGRSIRPLQTCEKLSMMRNEDFYLSLTCLQPIAVEKEERKFNITNNFLRSGKKVVQFQMKPRPRPQFKGFVDFAFGYTKMESKSGSKEKKALSFSVKWPIEINAPGSPVQNIDGTWAKIAPSSTESMPLQRQEIHE